MSYKGTGTLTNGPWWAVRLFGHRDICKRRAKTRNYLFIKFFLKYIFGLAGLIGDEAWRDRGLTRQFSAQAHKVSAGQLARLPQRH